MKCPSITAPQQEVEHQPHAPTKRTSPAMPADSQAALLALPSAVGNWAFRDLIQAKLTISQPGDPYEQKADRVAEAVMRMPEPTEPMQSPCPCGGTPGSKSACTGCQLRPVMLQHRASEPTEPSTVPPVVHEVLRSSGRPLDPEARAFFEPRFGHDFSRVRMHTDAKAAESARVVNALAYTVGHNVVFGEGQNSLDTTDRKRLLAHELAHVVQQRHAARHVVLPRSISEADIWTEAEADAAAEAVISGYFYEVTGNAPLIVARSQLNVTEIKADIDEGLRTPRELFSWLHVEGDRSGEVGYGATTPTGSGPDSAPKTDLGLPIQAFFFPSYIRHHDQRALILGGIHGDERPGFEIADSLVHELETGSGPAASDLYFHTVIIPHVNPGGIADNSRCNRQQVDLNRNFPVPGVSPPSSTRCPNTNKGAPTQPETQAVIDVINQFQPHRILSLHAITDTSSAGIFADPSRDPAGRQGRQLACSMAGLIVDPINLRGNRLTSTSCNPVYPGSSTGGTSLGAYGPTRSIPSQTAPVITLEVPSYGSLSTTGTRTVEAFMRPVRGFISDPAVLATRADLDIVRDIQAWNQPLLGLFLTGRVPSSNDIFQRIRRRIDAKVVQLNTNRPSTLPSISIVSAYRGFGEPRSSGGGQAHILFEKFTLTGRHRNGWDTLPDEYFMNGDRRRGVDRNKWLMEASATRLDIILRFSAVPGASRHHWGTDIDFNSTVNTDWAPSPSTGRIPAGRFYDLGVWLQQNAPIAGLVQAYTAGRTGGHAEEPWHYSYAPIAVQLRQTYNAYVRYREDVVDPVMEFFNRRANVAGLTLPSDLPTALANLDISRYVNVIGLGL